MSSGLTLVSVKSIVGDEADPCGAWLATDVTDEGAWSMALDWDLAAESFRHLCFSVALLICRPQNAAPQ